MVNGDIKHSVKMIVAGQVTALASACIPLSNHLPLQGLVHSGDSVTERHLNV